MCFINIFSTFYFEIIGKKRYLACMQHMYWVNTNQWKVDNMSNDSQVGNPSAPSSLKLCESNTYSLKNVLNMVKMAQLDKKSFKT